jgi:hypothetical protein
MKFLLSATVAALLAPAAAFAQSPAYYVATPAAAPVQTSVVTRSTLWRARGPIFFAARAPERPVVLCRLLADRAGPIASFAAGGRPLDTEQLAECNAKVTPAAIAAK